MTANSVASSSPVTLTPEQWQGLARLGELVQAIDLGLREPLGTALADNIVNTPSGAVDMLKAAVKTLTPLHESGLLRKLDNVIRLASEVPELWQTVPEENLSVGEGISQTEAKSAFALADEVSKPQSLAAIISLLRYVSQEAPQDFLTTAMTFVQQSGAVLASPGLLQAAPAYIEFLVKLQQSGLLDHVLNFVEYFQGVAPLIDINLIVSMVIEYLASHDLIDHVKAIRPENLALLLREASDPDSTAVLVDVLRLVRLLRNDDMVNPYLTHIVKISAIMTDPEFISTVPELLETILLVRSSGVLALVRQTLQMYPSLAKWDWNEWIASAMRMTERVDINGLVVKVKEAFAETERKSSRLGGLSGLMRLMKDAETQRLMQFAVILGNKLLSLSE